MGHVLGWDLILPAVFGVVMVFVVLFLPTLFTPTPPETLDFVHPINDSALLVQFNTTDGKFVAIYGEEIIEKHLGLLPDEYEYMWNSTRQHVRWVLMFKEVSNV